MTAAPTARTLFALLAEQAACTPDATAIIDRGEIISFSVLAARAAQFGAALKSANIGYGDRIGLLCSNRIEWLEIAFGCAAAGAVCVPFSTWSTADDLDYLIRDSEIQLLFALPRFGDVDFAAILQVQGAPRLREIVLLSPTASEPYRTLQQFMHARTLAPAPRDATPAEPGDDALILYTSGSSARPKAVRLVHQSIIENGFAIGERQGLTGRDRVLLSPPLFWSYGCANALPATFTHGAALVLQEKFDPIEAVALIEQHRCTALYTLPGMTNAMLRAPGFTKARTVSLRTGLTIGAPRDIERAATELGASEICNIYGATETYGNCCVTWHHWPLSRRAHCQGPPLPGQELRFVDAETGSILREHLPGLIEVRGHVTPGYTGASASQNGAIFTADGFFRTGDVGFINDDGAFVFVGRSTDMIKRAGINVSPVEVEDVLQRHPAVDLAGVVGVPDAEQGERIVAFVTTKSGSGITAADLVAHCRAAASKYKVPDVIVLRTHLPQTATGKLQRRELKQEAARLHTRDGGSHG